MYSYTVPVPWDNTKSFKAQVFKLPPKIIKKQPFVHPTSLWSELAILARTEGGISTPCSIIFQLATRKLHWSWSFSSNVDCFLLTVPHDHWNISLRQNKTNNLETNIYIYVTFPIHGNSINPLRYIDKIYHEEKKTKTHPWTSDVRLWVTYQQPPYLGSLPYQNPCWTSLTWLLLPRPPSHMQNSRVGALTRLADYLPKPGQRSVKRLLRKWKDTTKTYKNCK